MANRYNTDKAESNPRASVGRRSATISNRARQRDNPGTRAIIQMRCNQSPTGKVKGKGKSRKHGQKSNTGKLSKGKAKL